MWEVIILYFFYEDLWVLGFYKMGSTFLNITQSCPALRLHGLQSTRFLCPWDFPVKNVEVGCHFLLQGIFPTQGLNPGLLHCRQILYWLSYKGSPSLIAHKDKFIWPALNEKNNYLNNDTTYFYFTVTKWL